MMELKTIAGAIVLGGMAFFAVLNFIRDRQAKRYDRAWRETSKGPLSWKKIK
jgi:hypothetical protein